MRLFTAKVFDDVISGSTTTWYSRAEFNGKIGQAAALSVQGVTTGVSGALPGLTVNSEHSCDGVNWIATGHTEFSYFIGENGSFLGGYFPLFQPSLAAFVRYKIVLNGQAPQCRLKLYVTGRTCVF